MAHFAQLNEENVVINVIVVGNPDCLDEDGNESEIVGINFCKSLFGSDTNWKQCSYNNNIRVRYPAPGYTYNEKYDAFIPPKPIESWILDEKTFDWKDPTPSIEDILDS